MLYIMAVINFKYKHALALNPYFGSGTAVMGIFPPTGLEYIAASMKDHVGKITLMDLRGERQYQNPAALNKFIKENIDLLCISIRWETQFERICDFVCQLPPGITTVVGGYKATQEVNYLFERCPNVDMIVRGEGEEIIQKIVKGVPLEEIRGLSYRDNEEVIHNPNQLLPDVTKIAFPDRSMRRQEYFISHDGIRLSRQTFDTVLTTRGCPFKCKFCTFSLNPLGQKRSYTERPVESVIEELKTISADIVLFSDDNFFTNIRRAEQICDLIIENKIKKTFIIQARIDIARHPAILKKAQQAGFKLFLLGIESPHDRILNQLQKGITQKQIREAFAVLTKYDIFLHGYFIYGNISETEEEMLYIAEFAKEIKLDSISFQKLRVEKFSPLKEIVESTPGYYFKRIGGPVYSDKFGHEELKIIRNRIRSSFYNLLQIIRIGHKAWRIGLCRPGDLALILAKAPLLVYSLLTHKKHKKVRKDKNIASELQTANLDPIEALRHE
jgi:anaerobic magnesium-protoporphyrin IX monomethyl ester cyclase